MALGLYLGDILVLLNFLKHINTTSILWWGWWHMSHNLFLKRRHYFQWEKCHCWHCIEDDTQCKWAPTHTVIFCWLKTLPKHLISILHGTSFGVSLEKCHFGKIKKPSAMGYVSNTLVLENLPAVKLSRYPWNTRLGSLGARVWPGHGYGIHPHGWCVHCYWWNISKVFKLMYKHASKNVTFL